MSSFVGHTLAAIAASSCGTSPGSARFRRLWLGWLVVLACFPDLDYLIPNLRSQQHHGLRITHSVGFAVLFPLLTATVLAASGMRGRELALHAGQALAAGLSHLVLDALVGVTPAPWLWPLSHAAFRLPFGILPSAGSLNPRNPLLYRNLALEIGVLLPPLLMLRERRTGGKPVPAAFRIALYLAVSLGCMVGAYLLPR